MPILKLHSSCKVCLHAIEGSNDCNAAQASQSTSPSDERADANQYPRTRSEMSGTCDANYTGFDFALLLCLSTHCPLSEKMSTAGGFIKVLYYCWQINPFRVVKIPFNVHVARFYVDPHDVQKVAIIGVVVIDLGETVEVGSVGS